MHESTQPSLLPEDARHSWERRPPGPDDDRVLGHTWNWLNALPKGVRPVYLPADFPRIANALARLWQEAAALDAYFEEKEFSPRPYRKGFPPLIKEELRAVHLHSLRNRLVAQGERVPQQMSLLR